MTQDIVNVMTPATERKREELQTFIARVLEPEPAVQAVVGIGSIATGRMGEGSDIDIVVFFEPMDWYIIPAEFIWRPSDGTFHSIFEADSQIREEGLELDCLRLSLRQWSDPAFDWPEGRRAELANGWMAYDRQGQVATLIAQRTEYPGELRQARLDEALVWMDQHLDFKDPLESWDELGPVLAHDRLDAAFDYLVQALFAQNRQWLPWRNRRMDHLLALTWLPEKFADRVLYAANALSLDRQGYEARVEVLRSMLHELLARLTADGDYSGAPVDQAFTRTHDEPGYAWNMDDWNAENLRRVLASVADS